MDVDFSAPLGSTIVWHFEQKKGPADWGASFSVWQDGHRIRSKSPPLERVRHGS